MTAVLACAIFAITYALIATEKVHRVTAAIGGVVAMVLVGIVDTETAFYSAEAGIDWNVIFLLFAMMIIVGVLKQTGLFDYLAIWAAQKSQGRPFRLMVLLILITAVASAFLDNVTTVLLVAPVALMICSKLDIDPIPYLLTFVFASNIGGAATLIGDPPNIIIASRSGLTFNDFLIHMAPIVMLIMTGFIALSWLMFRRQLQYNPDRAQAVMDLRPRDSIADAGLLWRCLAVLVAVMIGFSLHSALHVEPSLVALMGAGAIIAVSQATPAQFLEEVEWPTLAFFMALFVLVGGLVEVGVIADIGREAVELADGRNLLAASGLIFGSGVLGALVDNIPYTAAMAPIVGDLVNAGGTGSESLW